MNQSKKYISNKKLYEAMIQHNLLLKQSIEKGIDKPKITNYIGECIYLICCNLAKKPNFMGYTYKDEFISDGIIDCISAVDNFDPSKTNNPFAYFTQIAWNAFVRRIHKERKQTYIKHKNFENFVIGSEYYEESDVNHLKNNDLSNEVIKTYENKLVKTKKPIKKIGLEMTLEERQ